MKICFIGAGALGSTIGGTLARSGADVWLIDPFQAHVAAINAPACACWKAVPSAS